MSSQEDKSIDYSFPSFGKSKWIAMIIAFFLIGLIAYFPFMYKIKSTVKSQLNSIPGCPVDYKDIKLELFLPKIVVEKLMIPQSCFNRFGPPLKMETLSMYFRGLSFSPFGPHFKIESSLNGIPLQSYLSAGIGGVAINLKDNTIDLKKLQNLIPEMLLAGDVKLDALVTTSTKGLEDLKLNIRSTNFTLPAQSIQGFNLYTMRLNSLLLKADLTKGKLKVENFVIGDESADIRANFKGDINLNMRNIQASMLDLKGEVAFSRHFLEKYSIIKMVMNKFDKKDQFYQIQLKGPITSPKPTSPR